MIPRNFDDVELGIVGIVAVVAIGTAAVVSLLVAGVKAETIAAGTAFVAVGITAIGSLARGRKD